MYKSAEFAVYKGHFALFEGINLLCFDRFDIVNETFRV